MITQNDARQKELKAFKKLPEEWRSKNMSAKTEEVYKEITKTAINTVQLNIAKEMDEDLKALQEQLKNAREVYTEGNKTNTLKIKFLVDVLRGRGVDVPSPDDFLKKAANGELEDQS
jgi:hypothetical protein